MKEEYYNKLLNQYYNTYARGGVEGGEKKPIAGDKLGIAVAVLKVIVAQPKIPTEIRQLALDALVACKTTDITTNNKEAKA